MKKQYDIAVFDKCSLNKLFIVQTTKFLSRQKISLLYLLDLYLSANIEDAVYENLGDGTFNNYFINYQKKFYLLIFSVKYS